MKRSRRCEWCMLSMWIEMLRLANRRKQKSCWRCGFYVFLILSVGFSRLTSIGSVIYYKLESNMHPPMNHRTLYSYFLLSKYHRFHSQHQLMIWTKFIHPSIVLHQNLKTRNNNADESTMKRRKTNKNSFSNLFEYVNVNTKRRICWSFFFSLEIKDFAVVRRIVCTGKELQERCHSRRRWKIL